MFVLDPPYKSLQLPTFLRVHSHPSALGSRLKTREAVAANVDSLGGPIIHKKWIVITSIPGQYIGEAFTNHG